MSETDLSRLRIDRQASRPPRRRLSKRWLLGGLAIVLAGGLAVFGRMNAPVAVETVTVGEAWPYQGVTLLNATGYVVAQRKAAVASKATGRLEWLGVMEGSRVKAGEVYDAGFGEVVMAAYRARIQLWDAGFYRTPKIHFDPVTKFGRPVRPPGGG